MPDAPPALTSRFLGAVALAQEKTAREQLWYYGGPLAFFQARRPGSLNEDLERAVAELAWLVARDHAQRHEQLWLWVDPDFLERQAPAGWAQVRTPGEAIALLNEFSVHVPSPHGWVEASSVIRSLIEQDAEGHDRWPSEQIGFQRQRRRGRDRPTHSHDRPAKPISATFERAALRRSSISPRAGSGESRVSQNDPMKEREVKLSAGEGFQLPDLRDLRGVAATPRTEQPLATVNFATAPARAGP